MNDLGESLLRFKTKQKYINFDFETCGLSLLSVNNRATQLGYTIYEGNKLIRTVEDWIWWDDIPELMSSGAAAITRFDLEEHKKKAGDPIEILDRFEEYALNDEYLLITTNGYNFDSFIWNGYRRLVGRKSNYGDWIGRLACVQGLAKAQYLQVKPPSIRTDEWISFNYKMAAWNQRNVKVNLKALTLSMDLPYDEMKHHFSASYDTELSQAIFQKQIWSMEIQ